MYKTLIYLAFVSLITSACGGGGGNGDGDNGDGDNGNTEPKLTAKFDITKGADNIKPLWYANSAAEHAVTATRYMLDLADGSSNYTTSSVASDKGYTQQATEAECYNDAGTLSTTLDDKDNDGEISAGDVVTMTANNCETDIHDYLNGKVVVTLTAYTDSDSFSGALTFTNLTTQENELPDRYTLNGSISAKLTLDDGQETRTITLDKLKYTYVPDGSTGNLISGVFDSTYNYETEADTLDWKNVLMDLSLLKGIAKASTSPEFSVSGDDDESDYFEKGVLTVEGANGNTVSMDASEGTNKQYRLIIKINGSTISSLKNWGEE